MSLLTFAERRHSCGICEGRTILALYVTLTLFVDVFIDGSDGTYATATDIPAPSVWAQNNPSLINERFADVENHLARFGSVFEMAFFIRATA